MRVDTCDRVPCPAALVPPGASSLPLTSRAKRARDVCSCGREDGVVRGRQRKWVSGGLLFGGGILVGRGARRRRKQLEGHRRLSRLEGIPLWHNNHQVTPSARLFIVWQMAGLCPRQDSQKVEAAFLPSAFLSYGRCTKEVLFGERNTSVNNRVGRNPLQ